MFSLPNICFIVKVVECSYVVIINHLIMSLNYFKKFQAYLCSFS